MFRDLKIVYIRYNGVCVFELGGVCLFKINIIEIFFNLRMCVM